MNSLLYWFLFTILLCLLFVFICYLVYNIIIDCCLTTNLNNPHSGGKTSTYMMYSEAFPTDFSNSDQYNMPSDNDPDSVSYATSIDEGVFDPTTCDSVKTLNGINDMYTIDLIKKKRMSTSKSVDDLEFCDPIAIDLVKLINDIEERAREIEKEVLVYVEDPSDVMLFYDLNGKLIILTLELCAVECEREELRKMKSNVMNYIENCQSVLKKTR